MDAFSGIVAAERGGEEGELLAVELGHLVAPREESDGILGNGAVRHEEVNVGLGKGPSGSAVLEDIDEAGIVLAVDGSEKDVPEVAVHPCAALECPFVRFVVIRLMLASLRNDLSRAVVDASLSATDEVAAA